MKKFCLILIFLFLSSSCVFSQIPYYYYLIPSGTVNNLNCIYNLDNTLYIAGNSGTVLKSSNTGNNWLLFSLGTINNLYDICMNSIWYNRKYYIVGGNGTIYRSSDYGANWISEMTGVSNNLNSGTVLVYSGDTICIAVGSGGIILKEYPNLNRSFWLQVISGTTNNLKSIYSSDYLCWVAGSNGTILRSLSGGSNWLPQNSGTNNNLNSVYFKSYSLGFVVGDNGIILNTTNGGYNWTQQSSGTTQNLNKIFPLVPDDTSRLCILGNNAVLFSTNGGINWTLDNNVPSINITSGYFIEESGDMFITGESGKIYRRNPDTVYHPNNDIQLKANKINSIFTKSGAFNRNLISNGPGFEWPKDSGKYAIFTSGLNIAARVNGEIRMAACSYTGEYKPGYCTNGEFHSNLYFKIYKVSKSDNAQTNWDWANWGQMVPYGAPYIDVNHNGIYEPAIDTPGVKNAKETLFLCMSDADPASHTETEGFGGGSLPLGAEVHMTAWAYDSPSLQNVQFISYEIINKSNYYWKSAQIGLFCDPDLGDGNDDYIGCDTALKLGYCYNSDNFDNSYGFSPPAVGMTLLRGSVLKGITQNINLGLSSFTYCTNPSTPGPVCEQDPNPGLEGAFYYLSGFKRDSTCFIDPSEIPYKKTKICYPGDLETFLGWTEFLGSIKNCGGDTTGMLWSPNDPGDRRFIMSSGSKDLSVDPGDTQKFAIAQLIARGSTNLISVTALKTLTAQVRSFYEINFPIGIKQISSNVPDKFKLFQNYPNPFNPTTKIKYQISKNSFVTLKVYDILGREVETLVNEFQQAGTYETQFPGSSKFNLASGIYFYKLTSGDFSAVKRMIFIK